MKKLENKEVDPYDCFFSVLRSIKFSVKVYIDFENLPNSSSSKEQAVAKLRLNNLSSTGKYNYVYLQTVWETDMHSFADFLQRCNKKYVVLILEATQKTI